MTSVKGRCHCGKTEYTVKFKTFSSVLCHCDACRTLSGSAFQVNNPVTPDAFHLDKGSLNKYSYVGDSGNLVHCLFCPNCTTHVYHQRTIDGMLWVRTSSFEGSKDWPVEAEIYSGDKAKWQPLIAQDRTKVCEGGTLDIP